MIPFRGSCQACGSVLPSVAAIGSMPSVAMTSGPRYCADWISRVTQPSSPRPLTTKSRAWARSRTLSGLGSKTCSFASRPIRLVTATSLPPTSWTMSSRMLNETTTRIGACVAKAVGPDQTRIKQRPTRHRRISLERMIHYIICGLSLVSSHMSPNESSSLIPVTLLTGFLGSGKTTVLNHVLKQAEMAATAVIVNEFGEIGLDHLLVEQSSEDVVLLNSGCMCCTVRNEIVDTLTNLFVDRVKGKIPFFTRVAIETTGLADPAPILHTLMTEPIVAARYMLDGVVTTVDAVNGARTLDRQPEAVKQAAVADRLLLTKTDLAEPSARQVIEDRLSGLNPSAPIVAVAQGAVDPALLFNLGFFDPATKGVDVRRWLRDEAFESDHTHHHNPNHTHEQPDINRHDDRIRAFCITRERPISWAALSAWLDALATMRGDDLLRLKAIVALPDHPDHPVVLHGVQHLFHPPVLLPEWPSEDRRTRMVFITRDLPREAIETTLAAFEDAVEARPQSS